MIRSPPSDEIEELEITKTQHRIRVWRNVVEEIKKKNEKGPQNWGQGKVEFKKSFSEFGENISSRDQDWKLLEGFLEGFHSFLEQTDYNDWLTDFQNYGMT